MSSHLELLYLTFHFWISSHNTFCTEKERESGQKNICNVKNCQDWPGKHQKAWKQEIRREQNSNPLQRNDTLSQLTVNCQLSGPSIYQLACHHHTWMNCVYAQYQEKSSQNSQHSDIILACTNTPSININITLPPM